ncbi:MAG TPA: hypothetical protein EYO78_06935 [Gammaproteobacteria bacterium]|nr:hypothetical protein [Gammaproteobacteria bacterium]
MGSLRLGGSGWLAPEQLCIGAVLDPCFRNTLRSKQLDADFGVAGRVVFCWTHPRGDRQLGS